MPSINPDSMQPLLSDFEVCARRAVECILMTPTRMRRRFSDLPAWIADAPMVCSLKASNGMGSIHITLKFAKNDLTGLVGWISDESLRKDAIGEIVNTLAGNFLGMDACHSRFGSMHPGLPFFGEQATMGKGARKLEGIMQINTINVGFGLAVSTAGAEGRAQ